MIWRLTYCNKKGVEARVDIIKGDRSSVEIVEGSGNPFIMSYRLDKTDKSGHIMTSSADIEIFETETFNIDDLKTSNETELKVEYFESNILAWSGFILPDFFSREIGSPNIVRMTASDRLTALKGVTLSDLPSRVSLRNLIELSLEQTGLTLGLVAQIQINQGSTNILDSEVLSQRLTDTKGRSISCYDILMSIMVGTNSTIRQRAGQWQVYNKLEHELRTPTIFFDKVERGAIRTIQPVASSVGVYHEHGGGRLHPDNYDFSLGLNGWIENSGFNAVVDNRKVDEFILSGEAYIPDYGEETSNSYLVNRNYIYLDVAGRAGQPRLSATDISIVSNNPKEVSMSLDVNMTGKNNTWASISVCVFTGSRIIWLNKDGVLQNTYTVIDVYFKDESKQDTSAIMAGLLLNTTIKADNDEDDVTDYHVEIDIYGAGVKTSYAGGVIMSDITVLVNSISVRFSSTSAELPKGNIFKTTQGSNYTKTHEIPTVLWGDYLTSGLNGYFYDYSIDDTSNLYLPSGALSSPAWKTIFDTTERPLLHHISRQKSRLFSVAHDILKANINVESFDPLAVFQDCKDGKYVVVSASFDFLRSEVDVELEQIAYDNNILKRDFIYSYFGEGEDTIKSIGGIAGGGGGTGGGGGMTSEQLEMLTNLADWWKLDEENDAIYSEKSVYSLKGVSALGLGEGGGGGGGDVDRLDAWEDYNATKAGWVLSAFLGKDLDTRVTTLESSSGSGSVTSVGLTVPTGLSVSGSPITGAGTFAISFASGYSIPTTAKQAQWDAMQEQQHTHNNKALLDLISQSNIDVLSKLSIVDGNIKVDTTLWATGGISALGLGEGGGGSGGGVDMLDSWANYTVSKANYYVPASLLVPFRSDTLSRLTSLESGSATSITTTGSGNAITSLTKLGSVITANKGLTFALSTHTHTIAQITGLQDALNLKASQSDITTAINGIEIGGRNLIIEQESQSGYISLVDGALIYNSGGGINRDQHSGYIKVDNNTTYTYSTHIIGEQVGGSIIRRLFFYDENKGYLGRDEVLSSGNREARITFTPPQNARYIGIYTSDGYLSGGGTKPKLEKGNKATDWTPAPEDQVSDWSTTDVASFSYIKNKPTQLSQFTDNIGVASHIANKANPHAVTKAQVGLGNVNNTADSAKNVLSATRLTTARTIAGVSFDGSANIAIPFANLASKPTTLSGYGITDGVFTSKTIAGNIDDEYPEGFTTFDPAPSGTLPITSSNIRTINIGNNFARRTQIAFPYNSDSMYFRRRVAEWQAWREVWHSGNLSPVTLNTAQTITGAKTFSTLLTASAGINTPKVDFGNGFTIEPSGTELVFKYNGVIKQRMLSDGTILATGGITALST